MTVTPDLTKEVFDSTVNYLKRSDSFSGNDVLTLPAFGSTTTRNVVHNLGYVPFFEVGYDADNDGTIWGNNKVDQYTQTSLSGVSFSSPELQFWSTTTTLSILLNNNTSPTATGTRPIYWVVYLDYRSSG